MQFMKVVKGIVESWHPPKVVTNAVTQPLDAQHAASHSDIVLIVVIVLVQVKPPPEGMLVPNAVHVQTWARAWAKSASSSDQPRIGHTLESRQRRKECHGAAGALHSKYRRAADLSGEKNNNIFVFLLRVAWENAEH